MSELSELGKLVASTSNMTLESAISTVRSFKLETRGTDYDAGFDDGIDQAIRAIQMFQVALRSQAPKLND